MTLTAPTNTAFIREDALILSFDTADTPFVARFDLDSLVQANFEVENRDGKFILTLRDFSGNRQTVGQFSAKADAHQALYAILQALLAHSGPVEKSTPSFWRRIWRMLASLVLFFVILALISWIVLFLMPSHTPTKTAAPVAATAPASTETTEKAPEGEPVDLNTLLPQAAPDMAAPDMPPVENPTPQTNTQQ